MRTHLLALLLALLPAGATARQFSSLRTDARVLVNDTGTAAARYRFTDAQVNAFLNECQREAVGFTLPLTQAYSFELVTGTTYYSVPSTFLAVRRLTWKNRVLPERSPAVLDQVREWETTSGDPQAYFVSFASRTKVGIYPFPASSSSTGTIKVEFYSQATDLSADTDQPFNGVAEFYPLHHILTYCAAGRMALTEGETQLAAALLQLAAAATARLGDLASARPNYMPQVSPAKNGMPGGP